jgi:hypothetical protein
MPIAIWVFVRLGRAIVATFNLLTDRKVMRELPWRYIRTLPLSNRWIGIATVCLVGSVAAMLVGLVVRASLNYALWIGVVGVGAPIVRSFLRSPRYRR